MILKLLGGNDNRLACPRRVDRQTDCGLKPPPCLPASSFEEYCAFFKKLPVLEIRKLYQDRTKKLCVEGLRCTLSKVKEK
jgi:hypothetical protein